MAGNGFLALQTIGYLQLDVDNEDASPEQRKLSKAVADFGGYIRANGAWIPNYGERYRSGEAIPSAFVESAVNQLISKRIGQEAANALDTQRRPSALRIRSRVLNDDLAADFQRWYPAFVPPTASANTELAA